jgi:hypothetical protein
MSSFVLKTRCDTIEDEEQPPPIYAFFARLEEVVDVGPCALTQHLNRYGCNILAKLGQENDLEATL